MTNDQLHCIETTLGTTLPEDYRRTMLNYPFAPDSSFADYEMPDDADEIILANSDFRTSGFFGAPWPTHYLTFGHDGAGNQYYFDLSHPGSAVFIADHETLEFERIAPDLQTWIADRQRENQQFEREWADRLKAKANKKWWQFWR